MNTVNSLAGGDITKYDIILNTPYNDIFVKLMMNKDEELFQTRLSIILQKEDQK